MWRAFGTAVVFFTADVRVGLLAAWPPSTIQMIVDQLSVDGTERGA
jgi:hypothetical protein